MKKILICNTVCFSLLLCFVIFLYLEYDFYNKYIIIVLCSKQLSDVTDSSHGRCIIMMYLLYWLAGVTVAVWLKDILVN